MARVVFEVEPFTILGTDHRLRVRWKLAAVEGSRRYQTYCEAWGAHGSVPKDFYAPVRSAVPTLLISGALDPATPPETARQAAHYIVWQAASALIDQAGS